MNEKGWNVLAAIAGITLLAAWALYLGIDGVLFALAVGIISGLGGVPVLKDLKTWYDVKVVKSFLREKK